MFISTFQSKRILRLLGAVSFLACLVLTKAESSWVIVDGHQAHPTKIITKAAGDLAAELRHADLNQVIKASGSVVVHQFSKLSGLMVLDLAPNAQQTLSGRQEVESDKALQAEALMERIQFLRQSGHFEYVEPNYIRQALGDVSDPAYADGRLWGLDNDGKTGGKVNADIDVDLAWDVTTGSKGVVVAVIDSGIRYSHQDIAGNMWINPGETPDDGIDNDLNGVVDDIYGFNTILQNGDPLDVIDHGTNVASVIGATSDDKDVVGVAQEVSLMAIKALTEFGGEDANLIQGIEYAVIMGADIINASWGEYATSQALFDAVAMAQSEGILFVAGAGNDGLNTDVTGFYPASYDLDNIISVASFDRYDLLADHSNYGQNTVDIAAPGREIYMAGSGDDAGVAGGVGVLPDEDYDYADGTSFAAPHVSGVAVLLKSLFPDAMATELKEMILASAVEAPAYANKVTTNGRLNAFNAMQVEPDGLMEVTIDPPSGSVLLTGEPQAIVVRVTDLVGIPDATVVAMSGNGEVINFMNDGQSPDAGAGDARYTAGVVLSGIGDIEMSIQVTHPNLPPVETTVRYTLVERPKNNDFEQASKLDPEGQTVATYSKFADFEEEEPFHAGVSRVGDTLWWTWSPAKSGLAIIDSAGSGYDTIIAVYQGDTFENLVEVASVDEFMGRNAAYLQLEVTAGETYRIVVGSYGEDRGGSLRLRVEPDGQADWLAPVVVIQSPSDGVITNQSQIDISGYAFDPEPGVYGIKEVVIRVNGELAGGAAKGTNQWGVTANLVPGFNLIEVSAVDFSGNRSEVSQLVVRRIAANPANDHYHVAQVLSGEQGQVNGNNALATKEHREPAHAGNSGGKSVWFQYQVPGDGELIFRTRQTRFDPLLAVYQGETLDKAVLVSSNDDRARDTGMSEIVMSVSQGDVYHIALDGFGGNSGDYSLQWLWTPASLRTVQVSINGSGQVLGPLGLIPDGREIILTAEADKDHVFMGWSGLPDEVICSGSSVTLTVSSNLEIGAFFQPILLTDDFESGLNPLGYVMNGWTVVEVDGNHRLQSNLTNHGSVATFSFEGFFRAGTGSFDLGFSTEENWDLFSFSIDGKTIDTRSGDLSMLTHFFAVSEGSHRLEWNYTKDSTQSEGFDYVWIDNLDLPLAGFLYDEALLGDVSSDASHPLRLPWSGEGWYEVRGSAKNYQQINSDPEYFSVTVPQGYVMKHIQLSHYRQVGYEAHGTPMENGGFMGIGKGTSLPVIASPEDFPAAARALIGGALVGVRPGLEPGDELLDDFRKPFTFDFGDKSLLIPGVEGVIGSGSYTFMLKEGNGDPATAAAYIEWAVRMEIAQVINVYIRRGLEGTLVLEVEGQPGSNYAIESSENLIEWEEIHTCTTDNQGRFQWRGVVSEEKAQSFFRAVTK